jgi:hypothetical protein
VINYPQFEQACKGAEGAGPIPYALLAATMAHSASYMPTLRPLHQSLWSHVLNALDAEFRQPRLQTLQLSTLLLSSRPGVNFAQSDITLSRVSLSLERLLIVRLLGLYTSLACILTLQNGHCRSGSDRYVPVSSGQCCTTTRCERCCWVDQASCTKTTTLLRCQRVRM